MDGVIAVANQKGGVAKTTTVHSLATAFADSGRRVLMVDLDPQACLTFSAGVDPDSLELSLYEVFLGKAEAQSVVVDLDGLSLLPSSIDMAGVEVHLLTRPGREYALQRSLAGIADRFDVVLIDCPPSLGVLTINGLTAASGVLIPLQCETLGHRGVGQLMETISDVRQFTNPDLQVIGVVATMYDSRTRLAHDTLASVGETYGLEVLDPPVPKSVRVAEAPGHGRSVLRHAPSSPAALAYRQLAVGLAGQLGRRR